MAGTGTELDIRGIVQGFARVERYLERNLLEAMSLSVDLVAEDARATHPYTDRTGKLTNSIAGHVQGSPLGGDLLGVVSAGAEYALYVEKGTRAHEIRPTHRKALRFPAEGGYRFAKVVHHPGTQPQPFLEPALERKTPDIARAFTDAVDLSFHQAGFE